MAAFDLVRAFRKEQDGIEAELERLMLNQKGVPQRLLDAMKHSLLGGGKRLRPVLVLWSWDALGAGQKNLPVTRQEVLLVACAFEMIHTYSLIHDDLPAMDDDNLRRGRPTCHVEFDEATAILAGDALHALAFQLLVDGSGAAVGPVVSLVADAVGPAGMVGGQQIDLDAEGTEVTSGTVREIHTGKTARLLMAAVGAGALLAGASASVQSEMAAAMLDLGLAFQGADDVLDVTATAAELGKTAGKDEVAGKATWVRVEGLERAKERVVRYGSQGTEALKAVLVPSEAREPLLALAYMLWNRDN
ncbi:MAG: farnesyl diphosphate synthase [Candidatus Krumholzibacteriia bacterium]|jgi:farnesyl diphosphate synthase